MTKETMRDVLRESLEAWKQLEAMACAGTLNLDKLARASVRQIILKIENVIDNSGGL